ncbi:hypothetical protein J437_LFUL015416, partial [Ladona fulva]
MDAGKLLLNNYHKECTMNSLCTEECLILKHSLTNLQTENHFKDVFLWGKINGSTSNYYVCFGYEQDALNNRVFYYSNNGMDWNLLPESKPSIQSLLKCCTNFFTGDPAFLSDALNKSKTKFSSDENAEKVKEEDRLAATITLISEEAFILPRGALFRHENGITTVNKSFKGNEEWKAALKYNKQNIRAEIFKKELETLVIILMIPKYKWETNLYNQTDFSYEKDYLDPINLSSPEIYWNLQLENGGKTAGMYFLEYYIYYIEDSGNAALAKFFLIQLKSNNLLDSALWPSNVVVGNFFLPKRSVQNQSVLDNIVLNVPMATSSVRDMTAASDDSSCTSSAPTERRNASKVSFSTWHARLGHKNDSVLKKIPYLNAMGRMHGDCDTCIQGKMKRGKFPTNSEGSVKGVLDRVHSDVEQAHQGKKVDRPEAMSKITFKGDGIIKPLQRIKRIRAPGPEDILAVVIKEVFKKPVQPPFSKKQPWCRK